MKVRSSNLTPAAVRYNQANVFLLPNSSADFAGEVEHLTSKFNGKACRVRFAREIIYPCDLTFCNEKGSVEVHSLSETLEEVNANDEDNLPTEKAFLIVPDDLEPQFINEICRQLCLLQIPFEIQTAAYHKFMTNPAQYSTELKALQELCEANAFDDEEISSLVTELATAAGRVESLINWDQSAPLPIVLGDFESMDFGLPKQNDLPPEDVRQQVGCVFVLAGENDTLSHLDEFRNLDKANILFILKKDATHLNTPLHLARTAKNLAEKGYGDACLTLADDDNIDSTTKIVQSFCAHLKHKAWNAIELRAALTDFDERFSKLQDKFSKFLEDSSHDADREHLLAENLRPEVNYLIDNESLLFYDLVPKALLYDLQRYIEQFWRDFQKNYREILSQIVKSSCFGEENLLHKIYKGDMPAELNKLLEDKEHELYSNHTSMRMNLQNSIQDFFSKRVKILQKLLPPELVEQSDAEPFKVNVDFAVSSNVYWWDNYFFGCLKKILSVEQLKTLVRHNSKILSARDLQNAVIFLEVDFRRELGRLLEAEFNNEASSIKARLMWEISFALKEAWSKFSDAVHAQIETAKEKFSSSEKESDAEDERRKTEINQYIAFFRDAQRATKSLLISD